MRTRPIRFDWLLPTLAGVSVALTLLTGSRGDAGVGVGEIGLAVCILIGLLRSLGRPVRMERRFLAMPHVLLIYGIFIMLPLTVVHFYAETPGSSMRDWLAYMLSFLFVFSLHQSKADLSLAGKFFLLALTGILVYQYFNGGISSWYSSRFTAGAKNPNQLALYCICGGVVAAASFKKKWVTGIFVGILFLFGLQSRSDAFAAMALAVGFGFVVAYVVPRRLLVPLGLPLLLGGAALSVMYIGPLLDLVDVEWSGADEGGGRMTLYKNGLLAWLSSIHSFLIGNGAGSFSGLLGPFGKSEAHNTPIDMLTIGGVLGLVFYIFPLKFMLDAYRERRLLLFSFIIGMVVFSLFHFVARQPVWWFALLCAAFFLRRHSINGAI
ncbi:hypothetical protein [Thermomonas sp.]|jgi:hypothetical protein|uniref:hypothetical protein n=1 Tax=Thermomonas sp. TaxID=1971895 RepID=UPI00257A3197|nr:hypothetical protein [Thermomonas sp.]